jgi:pimeloyl-ACP methyl ester carboxylesterase
MNPADGNCDLVQDEAILPSWRELFWPIEWAALHSSQVHAGTGLPRGDGQPVMLVPGFLESDLQMTELRDWLQRLGYRPSASGFPVSADCPDVLLEKILETLVGLVAQTGTRVAIVGHSLGGSLARAAATLRPDLVSGVVSLGSPLRPFRASRLLAAAGRWATLVAPDPLEFPRAHDGHWHRTTCSCQLVDALAQPFPATVTRRAIFTPTDGIIDWRSCLDPDPALNVEVAGTHLGLVANAGAYRAIAEALAACDWPLLREAPARCEKAGKRARPGCGARPARAVSVTSSVRPARTRAARDSR